MSILYLSLYFLPVYSDLAVRNRRNCGIVKQDQGSRNFFGMERIRNGKFCSIVSL